MPWGVKSRSYHVGWRQDRVKIPFVFSSFVPGRLQKQTQTHRVSLLELAYEWPVPNFPSSVGALFFIVYRLDLSQRGYGGPRLSLSLSIQIATRWRIWNLHVESKKNENLHLEEVLLLLPLRFMAPPVSLWNIYMENWKRILLPGPSSTHFDHPSNLHFFLCYFFFPLFRHFGLWTFWKFKFSD